MDFAFAFFLGLLGSLHCAAMCGPLMLALPVLSGGVGRFVSGRIIYQVGRVMTYSILGVGAGLVGRSIFVVGLQRWLSIGLGMAILLAFLVSKKISVSAPVVRLVLWLKSAMSAQLQHRSLRALTLLGLLNGLLPCGLVYVALAGAVAQGSWLRSLGYMAAFGLGTTPMMLGISLSRKLFPVFLRTRLRGIIPVGICAVAGLLILRGMSLGIPYLSPDLSPGAASCCAP